MDIQTLLAQLFPLGNEVTFDGIYFQGIGRTSKCDVAVIGTTDAAPIGVELAYRMAGDLLAIVRDHPGRPILLLVDTQGQRPSLRDELLGINGYMAHLAKCVELARQARPPHHRPCLLGSRQRRLSGDQSSSGSLLRAARG